MFKLEKHQFSAFILTILTVFVRGQMYFDDMHLQKQENSDITKDLTDKQLEMALSDLSLKDLNTLQKFIDAADYKEIDYQENNFINTNAEASNNNDYDKQDFNVVDYNSDQNDCNYNYKPQNYKKDLIYYINDQDLNQRTKRDDQKNLLNEEYIKQLDYSFPQNKEQKNNINNNNNNDALELKQAHVRVKRN